MFEDNSEEPIANLTFDGGLSLQDSASRFYFLTARDVLRLESFRRRQDLEVEPIAPENCHLLLFISHRWETPEHPDPMGKQLAALKSLINFVCAACDALSAESTEERLRFLPSLRQYGSLQAVLLVSRLSTSILTLGSSIDGKRAHEWLPDHIGIWYDFACLPQHPRSEIEEQEFQASLLAWPDLLLSKELSLIALRDAGDDYESRGWCFAEARLSSEKMAFRSLVLRLDRLGTMWSPETSVIAPQTSDDPAMQFKAALAAWEGSGAVAMSAERCWEIVVSQACIDPDMLPVPEDDSPVLGLRKVVQPSITWIILLLAHLGRQSGRVVNFSEVVLSLLKEKGLHCSDDDDLVYVGLLALLWSCAKHSRLAEFFRQCLERHIKNDGLLMRVTVTEGLRPRAGQDHAGVNSDNLIWEFVEQ